MDYHFRARAIIASEGWIYDEEQDLATKMIGVLEDMEAEGLMEYVEGEAVPALDFCRALFEEFQAKGIGDEHSFTILKCGVDMDTPEPTYLYVLVVVGQENVRAMAEAFNVHVEYLPPEERGYGTLGL